MATWKKVIVSGSQANLATLSVDNLTNGQVVIGGGTGNLSTTAINGSGNIVGTTGATGLSHSGSFSGSFQGDGSGLTGVIANAPNSLTNGIGITSFSYNGAAAQTVVVSGSANLTTNNLTKWTGTAFAPSSLTDNGTLITGTTSLQLTGASSVLTGSFQGNLAGTSSFANNATSASYAFFATTASYASNVPVTASFANRATSASMADRATSASIADMASAISNALTIGDGLNGTSYNGSTPVSISAKAGALITVGTTTNISVATASLAQNQIPKYGNGFLSGSNISDSGTTVTVGSGATGGLVVGAGGVAVTGNSSFANNVIVAGDFTVNGTTTFINTTNTYIKDQFIEIASGSTSLTDAGWIAQYNAAGSGSAFYLESNATNTYGRFAVAYDVKGDVTATTPDEYVVTVKANQGSAPSAAPTWGGTSNGMGNLWTTSAGDIYIYS